MARASDYVLGGTLTEQQRLLRQIEGFDAEACSLLDRIGVQPGWRAIDIGCGPLGILDRLSERVGPHGTVIGLEREPRFAAMGRTIAAERGLANVEYVEADGNATGLPRDSFDFVHERLAIIQQPDPERMLAEMVALARPGGIVVAQEIDQVSWLCEPPHPAWDALLAGLRTVLEESGVDYFLGRKLPGLLRDAGLTDVRVEVQVRVDLPGEYRRTHLLSMVESVREKILSRGLFTIDELDATMGELRQHLNDPDTVVIRQLLFQTWGRKP